MHCAYRMAYQRTINFAFVKMISMKIYGFRRFITRSLILLLSCVSFLVSVLSEIKIKAPDTVSLKFSRKVPQDSPYVCYIGNST